MLKAMKIYYLYSECICGSIFKSHNIYLALKSGWIITLQRNNFFKLRANDTYQTQVWTMYLKIPPKRHVPARSMGEEGKKKIVHKCQSF